MARSSATTLNHKESRHRPEEVSNTGSEPQFTKPVHTNCLSFEASICNKSGTKSDRRSWNSQQACQQARWDQCEGKGQQQILEAV